MSTGNLSVVGTSPGGAAPGALAKLSGLHEWLSLENRRVKQWWSTRSGTDLHKIYMNQLQDTDELRSQLNEQLRALDGRVDTQTALVAELQDWFRRRAELHQDYAAKLDKLAKSLQARHKEQRVKREQLQLFSVYSCWNSLVNQTRKDARDQAAMADVYLNNIIPRFTQVQDDLQRIYKRCREIGYESHEELLKVLHELHTTMRTYHTYQTEFKNAETKLRNFEAQRTKLEQAIPKEKLEKSKKFRVIEKEIQKRSNKYMDAKLKALKARNEYILSMDSANAAIHKYFVEDLSDIVDCMDFGFHSSIARALLTHVSGQECVRRSLQSGIDELNKTINNLDSRLDKQRFLEQNNAAFMLPKKFEFQGHKGDETHDDPTVKQVNQVVVNRQVQEEMEKRYAHLVSRLTSLKTESEETWKTIETAEKTLMEMINQRDYDCAHYFIDEPRADNKQPESMLIKMKADRQETEDFYLGKFREYVLGGNLITRLQARYELMRKALGDETHTTSSPTPTRSLVNKPRRRRIGRNPLMGQPKLFGGSLEEYLEATSQDIPLIMKSCIRVINLYGLHHQGIFRVSGSQLEINNFRESFERMEDPLADVTDASDINSVAGVLKLYLRELREPLFPTVFFDQFMEIAQLEKKHDFVVKMRDVVTSLPRPVFIVMRYLFAFLNHLSEFSDENMMDPYNLAICFGPTLVPIPEDKDQVQYQNLVNELIKNIIIFSEDIFPGDGGHTYEKFISRDSIDLDADMGDAPSEAHDDVDSEQGQSEDDSVFRDKDIQLQIFGKSEILEAIAQFDFIARSERELSFCKGDVLVLHSQVSGDWWKGSFQGKHGLIPDKYILLKIRDEDKDRLSERSAAEMLRRRVSSSSESILSSSTQQSSEGVIKPSAQNGAAQAPLSPSPASAQSQESCASPVSHDGQGGTSSSQGLDSGGGPEGAQADGGRSASPLPTTPGQASHSPTPPHSLQHGACLSLSDVSSVVSVQEEAGELGSSECTLQVTMSGEGGGAAPSSPGSPQPPQHSPCHLAEPVTQPVAPALVEEAVGQEVEMEEPQKGKNMEQLNLTNSSSPVGGGLFSRSMLEVQEDNDRPGGSTWEQRPRRPSQGSNLSSSSSEELNYSTPSPRTFWERRSKVKPVIGAPDLVMDLPVTPLSSSPKEQGGTSPRFRRTHHLHRESQSYESSSSSGGSSPGTQSPDMTGGEVFAKQNQCTLKKNPALKTFGGYSTDAQTQTIVPVKVSPLVTQRSADATELRITEAEEPSVSSIVRSLDNVMQQLDSEMRSDRTERTSEVRVEIRSASEKTPEVAVPPSTPKLAARYLQAVAASTGGTTPSLKPQVRAKPVVHKKPSLTRSSPEPDPSK
ncbi:SLIT-ROBO Rho GTPase-activating protein 1-like isoform X1 [Penaeus japonicus]|uniref:SLIT-ROBO Rho GTPase-activating protein 1-like isoform X1 n=1 Tax=Penaeus japonicus TaxID=27405 RepID=UPI001C710AAA|nr:SLIT-ROBO Rho GTPase-activating protein 1-like isoform X1 [Penaeus japonicus]XP_042870968.1 SLIT-ROBO Rho GTPase-activating protein 1-like isoform X1 [Penaeus japonicus]